MSYCPTSHNRQQRTAAQEVFAAADRLLSAWICRGAIKYYHNQIMNGAESDSILRCGNRSFRFFQAIGSIWHRMIAGAEPIKAISDLISADCYNRSGIKELLLRRCRFLAFNPRGILALVFDYVNGFHDTANAIATSVSTRALSPRRATILAASLNFLGALSGTAVAKTIGNSIIKPGWLTRRC